MQICIAIAQISYWPEYLTGLRHICAEQFKFGAEILWSKLPHFATKVGGNFDQKRPTIFRVLEIVFRTKSTHAAKLQCVYYLQAKN